ncbi:MAG TPA: hypothetical protein VKJ65_07870, partial [Phycisphaerae bacterium]|nr:hypothetical protein [Phycisphaerae bacterium]
MKNSPGHPKIIWVVVLAAVLGNAALNAQSPSTQPDMPPVIDQTTSPQIMQCLQMLQQRGSTLQNFSADLQVTTDHARTQEEDIDIGAIHYQQSAGSTQFDIHFDELVVDGAIASTNADHDILFDGQWLIDRDGSAKVYRKTQIAPPGGKFDPLKLGEGPIPIPIGQDPQEVLREFDVTLLPVDKSHAGLEGVRLVPRDPAAFTFTQMDFWIDPKTQLPLQIIRTDPDGDVTTAALKNFQINKSMNFVFQVQPPDENSGWTVEVQ